MIYTWSATGPASVSFSPNATNASQNATATFHAAGAYVLTATISDGTLTQTSTVPVTVSAVLTGISVSPATTTVTPGDPVIFSATTVDQFGNAMANQPTMTWSMPAQAGTISALGVATTSTTAGGPFTVSASASSISGTAQLTLQAGSVPPTGGGESSFALEGKQGESGGCGLGGLAAITGMMVFFTRARYRH